MAATDKTIDQLTPGNAAVSTDILPIERGGLNYFLTLSAISTFVNSNLNAVLTLTVGTGLLNTGTATNPNIELDVGTQSNQIPQLGDEVKGFAALASQIYAGLMKATNTFQLSPPVVDSIDNILAAMASKIPNTAVQLLNGLQGNLNITSGSPNVTITTNGQSIVITVTGGSGGAGVSSLNGLTGILEIIEGYGIQVDVDSSTGKITLSVPNNNLAATYVDFVLDINYQREIGLVYNNGTSGVGATLTSLSNGAMPLIDGQTPALGKRVFIKFGESDVAARVYTITDLGSATTPYVFTVASDFSTVDTMLEGTTFTVSKGDIYGGCLVTFGGFDTFPPVIGTSAATFNILPPLDLDAPEGSSMIINEKFLPSSETTNNLVSNSNTMISVVNGVESEANIINENSLNYDGNNLTSTLNGVTSSEILDGTSIKGTDPTTNSSNFINSILLNLYNAISTGGKTLPGISIYEDINADFNLPSPIPNLALIAPSVDNLNVRLPVMNSNPPALGTGQTFIIFNADLTNTMQLCYNDGTPIATMTALQALIVSVQDISTSNGTVVTYPIVLTVYSQTRGMLSGFVILNADDIEDGTTNHFWTPSLTVPISQGGTGQTTQQAALNALAGAVTNGFLLAGDGTNVTMKSFVNYMDNILITPPRGSLVFRGDTVYRGLPPGPAGYVLVSNGPGADPSYQLDPTTVTEFSFTPVDANGSVVFQLALGRGRKDGNSITFDITVWYPVSTSGQYCQINGWDPAINPADLNGAGSASTTTATTPNNTFANQCTLLVDRISLRCNGAISTISSMSNQYVTLHIEYYLDTASSKELDELLEKSFASGKMKRLDEESKKAHESSVVAAQEHANSIVEQKRIEILNLLDSVSIQSFEDAIKSKSVETLTRKEYNDIRNRIANIGAEEVKLEMFGEDQ